MGGVTLDLVGHGACTLQGCRIMQIKALGHSFLILTQWLIPDHSVASDSTGPAVLRGSFWAFAEQAGGRGSCRLGSAMASGIVECAAQSCSVDTMGGWGFWGAPWLRSCGVLLCAPLEELQGEGQATDCG